MAGGSNSAAKGLFESCSQKMLSKIGGASAEKKIEATQGGVERDLRQKFLTFYNEATKEKASPDKRWELWKKDYDFAAVPPTPEGEEIAKKLLNDAWSRYPAVLDRIREGAAGLTPDPHATIRSIAARKHRSTSLCSCMWAGLRKTHLLPHRAERL